jgi:hypothetical protein
MNWQHELADGFAEIEGTGDIVQWAKLRPDVHESLAKADLIGGYPDGPRLWGAKVEVVEGQEEPFALAGEHEPSVEADQAKWTKASLALVAEQGGAISQVTIEGTHADGTPFRLIGDWS